MRVTFTKMQGAGNDFVVLDETHAPLNLSPAQYRWLADRHFGVGADQILGVRAASRPDADFEYVIHNADGQRVENCGNGARCFVRFVQARGLTTQSVVRAQVGHGLMVLHSLPNGQVRVDMGSPWFLPDRLPFDAQHAKPATGPQGLCWTVQVPGHGAVDLALVSMGNPHAVIRVDDVDTAPVHTLGPLLERHAAFPERINVGFLQVIKPQEVRLRVFERGAGETLACGTGACAAVVAGLRLGWLQGEVTVHARGGDLSIAWPEPAGSVFMTGPAQTVFTGEIDIPEELAP
jgi:diaminopimelate epimerase